MKHHIETVEAKRTNKNNNHITEIKRFVFESLAELAVAALPDLVVSLTIKSSTQHTWSGTIEPGE